MSALTARRREARYDAASAAVARILGDASEAGIEITLVGSLARGDFRAHSDIDLLVRGPIDAHRRLVAERIVAKVMRDSDLPYDLVFEADLTDDRLREFLDDILARDIDGDVPSGPSAHQDVLDQMAAAVAGIRPAMLD